MAVWLAALKQEIQLLAVMLVFVKDSVEERLLAAANQPPDVTFVLTETCFYNFKLLFVKSSFTAVTCVSESELSGVN